MNGKSMMMLLLAVGLGLGAMVITQMYLKKPTALQEETQEILVAARDVKEEEILKVDMVKAMRLPKSAIPVGSFSSFKEIEDRWVKTALLEGDPVVEKRLGPKGTPPGLVANIPKGMRAFAIEVNEQSGVSGFILPGHRVDVVRFDNNERGVNARAETILQNVQVLAAGQVFMRAEEKSVQSRTVTLAVTPDQVDTLVAAKSKGPLSLALRGVNDHEVVDRPAPKPAVDDETKKQLETLRRDLAAQQKDLAAQQKELVANKEAYGMLEQDHSKLKQDHAKLEQAYAKKIAAPPPAPPAPPEKRWVHIYRPLHVKREEDRKLGEYPEKVAVNEAARKAIDQERLARHEDSRGAGFGTTTVTGVDREADTELESSPDQ